MLFFQIFDSFLIWSDWSIFFLRLILGLILILHGYPKLKNLKIVSDWMNQNGFKPGFLFAFLAMILEFFGGIFLVLGFLSQIVALFVLLQFLVIIIWRFFGHMSKIEFELDLLILAGAVIILFNSSGALSLDKFFGF